MEIPKISQYGAQIYRGLQPRLSAAEGRQEEAEENVANRPDRTDVNGCTPCWPDDLRQVT